MDLLPLVLIQMADRPVNHPIVIGFMLAWHAMLMVWEGVMRFWLCWWSHEDQLQMIAQ